MKTARQTTIEIEGQTLTFPEHAHVLAYLARVFEVGSSEPKAQRLSTKLEDCYAFLDERIDDGRYGDVVVYDVTWAKTRPPIKVKTLPSRPIARPSLRSVPEVDE